MHPPVETPCTTINKVCGSGLKSVALAAQSIMAGDAEIVVAGGAENMNLAPYMLDKARTGYRMGNGQLIDSMIHDGLWCIFGDTHMGITAENLAEKYGISRAEQDEFAAASQAKAATAIESGKFADEIDSRVSCQTQAGLQEGRDGHCRQRIGHQRRRGGDSGHGGRSGESDGPGAHGEDQGIRLSRR